MSPCSHFSVILNIFQVFVWMSIQIRSIQGDWLCSLKSSLFSMSTFLPSLFFTSLRMFCWRNWVTCPVECLPYTGPSGITHYGPGVPVPPVIGNWVLIRLEFDFLARPLHRWCGVVLSAGLFLVLSCLWPLQSTPRSLSSLRFAEGTAPLLPGPRVGASVTEALCSHHPSSLAAILLWRQTSRHQLFHCWRHNSYRNNKIHAVSFICQFSKEWVLF